MTNPRWEAVIGLEVHVQLQTKSKIFSGASTAYGAEPNVQACIIDLGMPGVLPVLNRKAVEMAVKFGLAVGAEIAAQSVFARKNYFYPDLPKGYQISQYELPIVKKGSLEISSEDGTRRAIGITRAHLEEDAGKSLHETFSGYSGIDLNRAGTPLLEIVSEPELRSAKEAVAYLKALHALVCYLEICDGNLQEGSFRCDANISVRPRGETKLGTRSEIKNVNSFRFVEKAILFEIDRHIGILSSGGKIIQETRLYDSVKNETRSMRSKEEANDYRYFPDPDLLPLHVPQEMIDSIQLTLPELPDQKIKRFQEQYALNEYDACVLSTSIPLANYFEAVVEAAQASPKLVSNWVMGELSAFLNRDNLEIEKSPVSYEILAGLIKKIEDKTLSGKMAKEVFEQMWQSGKTAETIIAEQGLSQVSDSSAIEKIVKEVIAQHPEQLRDYLSGKDKLLGFFVGQVMKQSKGRANPEQVNQVLLAELGKLK